MNDTQEKSELFSTHREYGDKKMFQKIIAEIPIPMCLYVGKEMRIGFINELLLKTWGKDNSVIGKTLPEVLPELQGQPFFKLLDDVFTTGIPYLGKDVPSKVLIEGKEITYYHDLWYTPILDDYNEKVFGILASGIDVTDKVVAQKKTAESELRFRLMVEHATVAIALTKGRNMVVENINAPMLRMINKTNEVIGKPLLEVLPELEGQFVGDILYQVFDSGEKYLGQEVAATFIVNDSREVRYFDISYTPLFQEGAVAHILHVVIDVTEQVTARKKIESEEEKARLSVESAGLGTYVLNLVTGELQTSEKFNAIWGIDNNLPYSALAALIHPDDRLVREHALEASFESGRLNYQVRIIWKDQSRHWIKVNGKITYDDQSKPESLIGVVQDITGEKDLQQQKDNFIAMASHELKTPITTIKAYTQILGMILSDKGAVAEIQMLEKMDKQLNQLNHLISDLLNISNVNSGILQFARSNFSFNTLITEVTEELQVITKHKLNLKLESSTFINCDRGKIRQVIINLISNAIKYSPDADDINVQTHIQGNQLIFCVQDFGIGISQAERTKVFEQFYRVNDEKHQTFPGLGLGLYISAEIIRREGGNIWVDSTQGKGSKFCFSLAMAEAKH